MTGRLKDLTVNRDGTQNVTVTVDTDFAEAFDRLKDSPVSVEIKKERKHRSKDANSFCWALCSEIGKALIPPLDKAEVYRRAIRAVGVYTPVPIKESEIETVKRRWEDHGTGWIFETVDGSKTPGYKRVHLYYGSSTDTVDEMRVLLEWLKEEARCMDIVIPMSKAEEEEILKRWGNA